MDRKEKILVLYATILFLVAGIIFGCIIGIAIWRHLGL